MVYSDLRMLQIAFRLCGLQAVIIIIQINCYLCVCVCVCGFFLRVKGKLFRIATRYKIVELFHYLHLVAISRICPNNRYFLIARRHVRPKDNVLASKRYLRMPH